jgi:hypothetical protein
LMAHGSVRTRRAHARSSVVLTYRGGGRTAAEDMGKSAARWIAIASDGSGSPEPAIDVMCGIRRGRGRAGVRDSGGVRAAAVR